jgi:hypothetical protein
MKEVSPQLHIRMEKYIQRSSIQIDTGEQVEKNLKTIEAAQTARTTHNKTSQRTV